MKDFRYRVVVSVSAKAIFAQLIGESGETLLGKRYSFSGKSEKPVTLVNKFGKDFATAVRGKKITKIYFDRNGRLYHGRIKAFADGMREEKLDF